MEANCYSCHGGNGATSGDLDMSSRAKLLKGGASGAAVVLGKPAGESLFVHAIRWEGREMPPSGKLTQAEIDDLTKWVEMGSPWPAPAKNAPKSTSTFHGPPPVNAKNKKFWSFVPVKPVAIPKIKSGAAWVKTPIDAFVLARLQTKKLHPNPPAQRAALCAASPMT